MTMLLITHGLSTLVEYRHPHLGRLLQPRHFNQARETHEAGFTWAADNDAYNGWDETSAAAFEKMMDELAGVPGCRFVTSPDVVGEAGLTNLLWEEYAPQLLARGLPAAYVLQDTGPEYGCGEGSVEYETWGDGEDRWIPWGAMDALFIGGSDDNHFNVETERIVREAKRRGKWVHMGRVNSLDRIRFATEIGCDSVDGTQWVRWRDRYLVWGLEYIERLHAVGVAQRLEI